MILLASSRLQEVFDGPILGVNSTKTRSSSQICRVRAEIAENVKRITRLPLSGQTCFGQLLA